MQYKPLIKSDIIVLALVFSFLLLTSTVMPSCAKESNESAQHNWEVSVVDTFDPQQGCLSVLPWLTTLEKVEDTLATNSLPEDELKQWQSQDGNKARLTIYNIKLKEFQYPLYIELYFQKDLPEAPAGQHGLLLCGYVLGLHDVDGYQIVGADGTSSNSFYRLSDEQQEAYLAVYDEDRRACLQALSDKYPDTPHVGLPDSPGVHNMFDAMKENSKFITTVNYQFPGCPDPTPVRVSFGPMGIVLRFQNVSLAEE